MPAFYSPLRELRKQRRKTQKQVADTLCITESAYGKVERGKTALTVARALQLARHLGVMASDLIVMPTPDVEQVGAEAAELACLRAVAENQVFDAYFLASMQGEEERVPFEELDDLERAYLESFEITTREEYEETDWIITRPKEGEQQAAFERVLHDPNLYSLFQHSIIKDDLLLRHWQEFQVKNTPYFVFDAKPFGPITARLVVDTRVFTKIPFSRDPFGDEGQPPCPVEWEAVPEAAPEPDLPEYPQYKEGDSMVNFVFAVGAYNRAHRVESTMSQEEIEAHCASLPPAPWTDIMQTSIAEDIIWALEKVVFDEPDPLFAYLRESPDEYANTLTRLTGVAWVMNYLVEGISPINVVEEERARLAGEAPSEEYWAAWHEFTRRQREVLARLRGEDDGLAAGSFTA